MKQRSIGIRWYTACTNAWVFKKQGLTSGQWTNVLKMSINSMSNRGTGGRSVGNYHCRRQVCGENKTVESLPRIRGTCSKTELLRNAAHHKIRSTLANLFRVQKLEVYEEIPCQAVRDSETQNKRADIIVIDLRNESGICHRPNNSMGNKYFNPG